MSIQLDPLSRFNCKIFIYATLLHAQIRLDPKFSSTNNNIINMIIVDFKGLYELAIALAIASTQLYV